MNAAIEWANGLAGHWARGMWPVLWQTAALAAVVGLIVLCSRRMSPALRFWLWMLVPLRLLVMPLIVITLPVLARPPAAHLEPAVAPSAIMSQAPVEAPALDLTVQPETPSIIIQRHVRASIWTWLMAGWIAGIGFFAFRLARGWLTMKAVANRARESNDARVRDCAREAAAMLGLRKIPKIMSAPKGVSPFVLGFLRPVVVLPSTLADQVSPEELRSVLAHEFAHVRRRDALVGWILACSDVIYFFNPLVHLVKRAIIFERERACDEQVLALARAPRAVYARALLTATGLTRPAATRLSCAPVLLESGQHLERRLKSIADERRPSAALSRTARVCLLLVAVLALPGITCTERSATAPAAPPVEDKLSASTSMSNGEDGAAPKSDKVVRYDCRIAEISYATLEELLKAENVTLKEQAASQEVIVGVGDATFLYAVLAPDKARAFETRIKQMLAESRLKITSEPQVLAFDGQSASLTDSTGETGTTVSGYRPTLDKGQICLVPTLSRYTKQGNRLNVVSKVRDGAIECRLKLELAEQIGSVRIEKPSVESPVVYQQSLSLACTLENNGTILIVPPLPWRLIDNLPVRQQLVLMMLNLSASPAGSSAAPTEEPKAAAKADPSQANLALAGPAASAKPAREFPQKETTGPSGRRPTGNCLIGGKVVSAATGEPVVPARVYLFYAETLDALFIEVASDGSFEFKNIPAGKYHLKVINTAGYQDKEYDPENRGGQLPNFTLKQNEERRGIVFKLEPAFRISGRLLEEDGKPLAQTRGFAVLAWAEETRTDSNGAKYRIAKQTQIIGKDGSYLLDGLDGHPVYVMALDFDACEKDDAYPPCYHPGTFSRDEAKKISFDKGPSLANMDIRLRKKGGLALEGIVSDESTGKPVAKALVTVHHKDMLFDRVGAYTDDQGRYRVECLGPGEFLTHVDATPQGFVRTRRGLSLDGSMETSQSNSALKRGVTISGKFVNEESRPMEIAAGNTFGSASVRDPNAPSSSYSGWRNRYGPHTVGSGVFFLPGDGAYEIGDMVFPSASSFLINGTAPGKIFLTFSPYTRGEKVSKILYRGKDVRESGIQAYPGDVITDVEIVIGSDETTKSASAYDEVKPHEINPSVEPTPPQPSAAKVPRGMLGVVIQGITPEQATQFGLSEAKGALVAQVNADSAANKAGVKARDVIVRYDGKEVANPTHLRDMVAATAPDTEVKLGIIRSGKEATLTVRVRKPTEEMNVGPPTKEQ